MRAPTISARRKADGTLHSLCLVLRTRARPPRVLLTKLDGRDHNGGRIGESLSRRRSSKLHKLKNLMSASIMIVSILLGLGLFQIRAGLSDIGLMRRGFIILT